MPWIQNYTPIGGSLGMSALVAAVPLVIIFVCLAVLKMKAHKAAMLAVASAFAIAVTVWGMPAKLTGLAFGQGAAFGLFPVFYIVLTTLFLYNITVKGGQFEIIRASLAGLTADRRIQALLIAFSFGAFIEGAAGFGTPVAISAAMLIGLGFRPLQAAGLALIGNTAPVAYGALGSPLIALAGVTGLPLDLLSAAAGRILPIFSLIVPFWIIWTMAGRKAMMEVWPACLVAGGSFAIAQFAVSNYHGPWLVDIIGAIISMTATVLFLKVWQPKTIWRYEHEREDAAADVVEQSGGKVFKAWLPWVFLSVFVFAWGTPQVKTFLNGGPKGQPNFLYGVSVKTFEMPGLHKMVIKAPPVVAKASPEAAVWTFNWLSLTGTSLLLAGILSGLVAGFGPLELVKLWGRTVNRVKISLLTIAAMLALGFVSKAAGLDATMGLAFASTGMLFPFFSAMLGWLGVALTGSDTSSNVLFGGLQKITAEQLGLNPILTAAANTTGGVMGKMIDAQSLVVASVATNQQGEEGTILRYVFWHSIALAAMVGVVIFLYARVLPASWMPSVPPPAPVAAAPAAVVTAPAAPAAPAALPAPAPAKK